MTTLEQRCHVQRSGKRFNNVLSKQTVVIFTDNIKKVI